MLSISTDDILNIPFLKDSVVNQFFSKDNLYYATDNNAGYLLVGMMRYYRSVAGDEPYGINFGVSKLLSNVDSTPTVQKIAEFIKERHADTANRSLACRTARPEGKDYLRAYLYLAKVKSNEINELLKSSGIEIKKELSIYLSDKSRTCLVTYDAKSLKTVIITTDLNEGLLYKIGAAFIRLVPHFGLSSQPDGKIKELAFAADKCDTDAIYKILMDAARELDLERKAYIAGIEKWYQQLSTKTIREAEELLKEVNEQIRLYLSKLSAACEDRDKYQAMLLGAKENKSDCSALKDYFISQPAINITSCTSSAIEFVASGYLDLYDKDYVENMLSNKNSYIFSIDCSFNKSDIKEILKAIFVDEKYKIRTQAQFILQSDPLRIKAIRGAINGDRNVVVPNPHLDGHGCMGGNDVLVATAIKNRDVQTMLDIAVSSTHNINFADSIVVTTFIRYLASHQNTSFLQDEDGVCVTVSQLLEAERKAERCRAELN